MPFPTPPQPESLDGRVTRVEAEIGQIHSEVGNLRDEHQAARLETRQALASITAKLDGIGRTDWRVVFAVVSVVIAVFFGGSQLLGEKFARLAEAHRETRYDIRTLDGRLDFLDRDLEARVRVLEHPSD